MASGNLQQRLFAIGRGCCASFIHRLSYGLAPFMSFSIVKRWMFLAAWYTAAFVVLIAISTACCLLFPVRSLLLMPVLGCLCESVLSEGFFVHAFTSNQDSPRIVKYRFSKIGRFLRPVFPHSWKSSVFLWSLYRQAYICAYVPPALSTV